MDEILCDTCAQKCGALTHPSVYVQRAAGSGDGGVQKDPPPEYFRGEEIGDKEK